MYTTLNGQCSKQIQHVVSVGTGLKFLKSWPESFTHKLFHKFEMPAFAADKKECLGQGAAHSVPWITRTSPGS